MDSSAAKKDLEIAIREVVPEFGSLDAIISGQLDGSVSMDFPGIESLENLEEIKE